MSDRRLAFIAKKRGRCDPKIQACARGSREVETRGGEAKDSAQIEIVGEKSGAVTKRERERVVWLRFCEEQVMKMSDRRLAFIAKKRGRCDPKIQARARGSREVETRGGEAKDSAQIEIVGEKSGAVTRARFRERNIRICLLIMQV
ncbi:unnamed protein product [Arabidopsis lyrata]|uniref:Predicted protein n=1 Tax=Arabidopsis lyrata subsp. lyrata TaxID=81972 RepID=D7MHN6_ARALL|nr:predicted protein [Arabidopsis lyrata subsp. lyrata]CAH8277072.1 unnamed protein product [Arabidopsis lyrata]